MLQIDESGNDPADKSNGCVRTLELNGEFKKALDLLENTCKNLFITGNAGTGKSTLLDYFRSITKKQLVALAPTGVAAVNIQGETIHSFFGFHPDITPKKAERLATISRNGPLFRKLEMIIIDEVSMVRADLLDSVDAFLRTVRRNQLPFGGVQMVFIGDLHQLSPVVVEEEKEIFSGQPYQSPYFFDASVARNLFSGQNGSCIEIVQLEKMYRQHDEQFISLLNAVRNNNMTEEQIAMLNQRHLNIVDGVPEDYIYLTSVNAQADEINHMNLDKLPFEVYRFEGTIEGRFDHKYMPTELVLSLKKDARVMLLNNDKGSRWINGTIGTIVEIKKDEITVMIDNGETVYVEPFTWDRYRPSFNPSTGTIENEKIGSFTQFPVRLAWAITIHKGQSKTFDKIIVDVGRGAFAHGQVYVALSRCRTFEGIILKTPIKKYDIKLDDRVVRFLSSVR